LTEENYDLIGYPQLVRLNPNIPWKTRGNGAISFKIGKGKGGKTKIGEINNKEIFCYQNELKNSINEEKPKEIIEEIINEYARLEDKKTNPGYVLLNKKPSYKIYKKTAKQVVTLRETEETLNSLKATYKGYKNCRGLIGATASIAWLDRKDKTFELIAYRERKKWGSLRFVDDKSTKNIDKKYVSTFDNYDYKNKHNRLVPSSPCPVLFGIRGENEKDLANAKSRLKSEKISSWIIFVSNQGTDDHLQRKVIKNILAYESVIVKGEIIQNPYTIRGGHVFFRIQDDTGTIDCAAYEPTKQFRELIRELIVGDIVEAYGGVRKKPLTINLEKINILHLEDNVEKVENPVCNKCGKHMKSRGAGQGYKCIRCGTKSDSPIFKEKNRNTSVGFYEVPVCARRHLSKPLKRFMEP